jgi:hypothetical protein
LLRLKVDAEFVVLLSDSPKLFVELVRVLLFGRELPDQRFIVTLEQASVAWLAGWLCIAPARGATPR